MWTRIASGVLAATSVAAACSSTDAEAIGEATGPTTGASTTSTTIPNRPPTIRPIPSARATIGETYTDAVVVSDPDGDVPTIAFVLDRGSPAGVEPITNARGAITGFEWTPTEPGEWTLEVLAVDPDGLQHMRSIDFVARAHRPVDLLLALGGSLAAGAGRDRSDVLGSDDCWRAEGPAYPTRVFERLIDRGALAPEAEYLTGACRDMTSAGLTRTDVTLTDGSGDRSGEAATSIEHAVGLNPTIVLVGPGIADIAEPSLEDLFVTTPDDDVRRVDRDLLDGRITLAVEQLALAVDELLERTDARIVVTDVPKPTAPDPVGVDGCDGECFDSASTFVFEELNGAIALRFASLAPDRISFVSFVSGFDGRTAPNAYGPDALRDLGPFGDLVGRLTDVSAAHCAAGDGPENTLVSRFDCVHPNDEGHEVLAELVVAALAEI